MLLQAKDSNVDYTAENMRWVSVSGAGASFQITIAVTLGVGVEGAFSASATGGVGGLFTVQESNDENKPNPHLTVNVIANVEWLVQAFFLKMSGVIISKNWKPYDNWEPNGSSTLEAMREAPSSARYLLRNDDGTLGYSAPPSYDPTKNDQLSAYEALKSYARVVTSGQIARTAEWLVDLTANSSGSPVVTRIGGVGATGRAVPAPALRGLSANDAIRPESDVVILAGAYSDSRVKEPAAGTVLYINSVQVETQQGTRYRSRIVDPGNELGLLDDAKWTIEDDRFTRADMFDYDFDSVYIEEDDVTYCLVTGGLRSADDETLIDNIVNAQLLSFGVIDHSDPANTHFTTFSADSIFTYERLTATQEGFPLMPLLPDRSRLCISVSTPKIARAQVAIGDTAGSLENRPSAIFSFLLKWGDTPEDLVNGMGTMGRPYTSNHLIGVLSKHCETGIFGGNVHEKGVVLSDASLSVGKAGERGSSLVSTQFYTYTGADGTSQRLVAGRAFNGFSVVRDTAAYTCDWEAGVTDDTLADLPRAWPNHGALLVARDGFLYRLDIPEDGSDKGFAYTRIDVDGFSAERFAISKDGSSLFFMNNCHVPKTEEVDGLLAFGNEVGQTNTIMCSKILCDSEAGETFTPVYPLAETDFAIDALSPIEDDDSALSLMATTITSAADSISDVHALVIPHVTLAKAVAFEAENHFVRQGAGIVDGVPEEPFMLTIKNVGNTLISGFTAIMADADTGEEIGRKVVRSMESSKMVMDLEDYHDADETRPEGLRLSDYKADGVLVPAQELTYRLEFPIPKDWSGEKSVTVQVTDFQVPGTQASLMVSPHSGTVQLVGQDATNSARRFADPVVTLINNGTLRASSVLTHSLDPATATVSLGTSSSQELSALRMTLETSDQARPTASTGTRASKENATAEAGAVAAGGGTLPQTGDGGPTGALAAVLGAGAMAVAAYERRRALLEDEGRTQK